MTYNFKDKVVWVTGASKGIGLALTNRLIEKGAKVIASSRNQQQLSELFATNENCLPLALDVTDKSQNQQAVEQIIKHFGHLDCCILNAGNAEYVDGRKFSSEPFERMIEINYYSQLYAIEAVLPELRKSEHAYLVGMSSSISWIGINRGYAYSASKAASRNFFQGLRHDLSRDGIPVSVICPGFVKTPLTDKNDFPMPFLISAEDAAERIVTGLEKQKLELSFPKRFTFMLKLISSLPEALSYSLIKRMV